MQSMLIQAPVGNGVSNQKSKRKVESTKSRQCHTFLKSLADDAHFLERTASIGAAIIKKAGIVASEE